MYDYRFLYAPISTGAAFPIGVSARLLNCKVKPEISENRIVGKHAALRCLTR